MRIAVTSKSLQLASGLYPELAATTTGRSAVRRPEDPLNFALESASSALAAKAEPATARETQEALQLTHFPAIRWKTYEPTFRRRMPDRSDYQ
jgi:hypothetical protein